MCKPIPGNYVRARRVCEVKPLGGSSEDLLERPSIVLSAKLVGLVADQPAKDDDHRIIMFGIDSEGMPPATLVAELHCNDLKGVEL